MNTPTVIIAPGLGGSSKQHYVRNFVVAVRNRGWRSVVLNHRGCNSDIEHPSLFTIGDTSDLRKVFEYVHENYPASPILAAGFSMGANILLKYTGEYHNSVKNQQTTSRSNAKQELTSSMSETENESSDHVHIPLHGVVSISQGYNVKTTSHFLPRRRRFYDYGLNLKYLSLVRKNRHLFEKEEKIVLRKVLKTCSMVDFDSQFTIKLLNYDTVDKYYENSCCSKFLPIINVPTLLLNALDDPIIPEYQVRPVYDIVEANEKLMMVTTKYGGHLAFVEPESFFDIIPKRVSWMDKFALEYLEAALNTK